VTVERTTIRPTAAEAAPRAAAVRVVTTRAELRSALAGLRAPGREIGLVPTMGALHAGHLSLVEAARRECDAVVVSIFVNPTQFAPGEDYARYPRDLDRDLALLDPLGVALVFAPDVAEIYGPDHATFVEVGGLSEMFEGASRAGHFRGVATVVLKLLNLLAPDVAYFGQKDYQQSLVVRRMVEELDLPVRIRVCPIVREADGLALSSRNVYLAPDDRRQALVLSQSLVQACELFAAGERDAAVIRRRMQELIEANPRVALDYAALADADTLAPVNKVIPQTVALVAARIAGVRLIDNCFLGQALTTTMNANC